MVTGCNMYCWNNKCLMYNKPVLKGNINIKGFKVCEMCYNTLGLNPYDPLYIHKKVEINVLEMGGVLDKSKQGVKLC